MHQISNKSTSRRDCLGALGTIAAIGVAGCLSSSDPDPATVEATIVARDGDAEATIIEDDRTIDGGDFYAWEFELDWEHEIDYTVEVTDGPDLGVYLVDGSQMDALRDGNDFEAIEDAIWTSTNSVSDTILVGEGAYWLVVINADVEPTNA